MLLLKLSIRNILRHPLKNILIGSLIALGTGLLFCANSVFESTKRGLQTSFIGSLTGDFAVSAKGEEVFGLFGSEVPIVSEYENIPPIVDYTSIIVIISNEPKITHWTPIVSTAAQVNIGGYLIKAPIFGVEGQSYFQVCSDIVIEKGDPALLNKGGVFLNATLATNIEKELGRTLKIGEPVVFSMITNGSFRVRRAVFSGIYRYPAPTEVLDRVILADPLIVRGLCDYTMGYAIADKQETKKTESPGNLDDLFAKSSDIPQDQGNALEIFEIEKTLADTNKRDALTLTDAAAWSFILTRVAKDKDPREVQRKVAADITKHGIEARVLDWRTAAGSSALLLFAVRSAFNIGICFLLLGASLIVMNALVISVLERTSEIGSMRALGASQGFIRSLFVFETMILTIVSAFSGIILGILIVSLFAYKGIALTNPLLITLFGGVTVHPAVDAYAIFEHLLGATLIGSLAWIYPVSIALKIKPISAISKQ